MNLKTTCVLLCAILLLAGCRDDDTAPDALPATEYTLMLYGCGGGNLDDALELNLEEALVHGPTERVKMTVQVKFSRSMQDDPELKGTRRWVLGEGEKLEETVMDVALPLYDPDNLADFIRWSREQCPARNYILVLWNHGSGWMPEDDPAYGSRSVVIDDNLGGRGMTIGETVEGVTRSNTRLKMIYHDACLMGLLENYFELASVADYALGASHITPGEGGEYGSLLLSLDGTADFESAVSRYCRTVVAHWNKVSAGEKLDLKLTDLSKLEPVGKVLGKIADHLVANYDEQGAAFDAAGAGSYHFDEDFPYYDVMDYVENLVDCSHDPALFTYASALRAAVDDALPALYTSDALGTQEISFGVTLVNATDWSATYADGSYEALAFDKAVRWSRWLAINRSDVHLSEDPEDDHQ